MALELTVEMFQLLNLQFMADIMDVKTAKKLFGHGDNMEKVKEKPMNYKVLCLQQTELEGEGVDWLSSSCSSIRVWIQLRKMNGKLFLCPNCAK